MLFSWEKDSELIHWKNELVPIVQGIVLRSVLRRYINLMVTQWIRCDIFCLNINDFVILIKYTCRWYLTGWLWDIVPQDLGRMCWYSWALNCSVRPALGAPISLHATLIEFVIKAVSCCVVIHPTSISFSLFFYKISQWIGAYLNNFWLDFFSICIACSLERNPSYVGLTG